MISAIGVALIAHTIEPERLSLAWQGMRGGWVGAAIIVVLATYFARTRRWSVLLRPLTFRRTAVLRALLTGQLLNLLLPIRVGDVARSVLLGREPGGSFARVFGSVLIEKAWDWLALCALVLSVVWAVPVPDWFLTPARSIGLLAALIIIGFAAAAIVPERWILRGPAKLEQALAGLPARWRSFTRNNLLRLLDSLTVLRRRDTLVGAAGWTALIWSVGVIINYALLRAFSIDSWLAAITLLAVLLGGCGSSAPPPPPPPPVQVAVQPSTATARVNQTLQFTATVTNAIDRSVTWRVNDVAGGNATVGTISTAGLYTAPASIATQQTVTVTATSAADPSKSASASVNAPVPEPRSAHVPPGATAWRRSRT